MNSPHSSQLKQPKIPTYSGFFEVWIVEKGTETRAKKSVYFNYERQKFYAVSEGDSEAIFRGPEQGLELVGYSENGQIKFPNPQHQCMETILVMNSGVSSVSDDTKNALEIALAAKKLI